MQREQRFFMNTALKTCNKCGEQKSPDKFVRPTMCRDCVNARQRIWYANASAATKQRYIAQQAKSERLSKFGTDGEALLEQQNNACAICSEDLRTLPSSRRHLDHCHTTNKVRGWLCGRCNNALGLFDDSTERLRAAAAYLEQFSAEGISAREPSLSLSLPSAFST